MSKRKATQIQLTEGIYPIPREEYQKQLAEHHAALFAEMLFRLCPHLRREMPIVEAEKKAA